MKNILLLVLSVAFLVACAEGPEVDQDGLQRQINDLKSRVSQLENQMSASQAQLDMLGGAIGNLGGNLYNQVDQISLAITNLNTNDANFQDQLNTLSTQLNTAMADASVLEGRISGVEGASGLLNVSVNALQADLATTNTYVNNLTGAFAGAYSDVLGQLSGLQSQIYNLSNSSSNLESNVMILQNDYNSALVQLAELQSYPNVVAIKDPCGAQGSWNEVLLKLSTGQYLGSFSENANGKNTRFVILQDGTYQTTDDTGCMFTISGNGTVISNEHN